jgi:hypothetical protein
LTADSKVYSRDERIRVTSVESTENTWTLLIKYIQKDDEGIYDCQVVFQNNTGGKWHVLKVKFKMVLNFLDYD